MVSRIGLVEQRGEMITVRPHDERQSADVGHMIAQATTLKHDVQCLRRQLGDGVSIDTASLARQLRSIERLLADVAGALPGIADGDLNPSD